MLLNKYSQYTILVFACILTSIGVVLLYSAAGGDWKQWALPQFSTMIGGIIIAVFIAAIKLEDIYKYSYHIYFITVLLLVLSLVIGYKAMGAQRWIRIGGINFQPSELAKIGLILALSRFYHRLHFFDTTRIRAIFIPLFITLVPAVLILKQPNLGTTSIMLAIFISLSFLAGINILLFIVSSIAGIISLPMVWFMLYDYQRVRVMTFLNPEEDPFGAGYNVIQSKIAIGSGGLLGKGLLLGSQGQLRFLPEKHTDFILALLGEEFGFIGIVLVMSLLVMLILLLYLKSQSFFNQYGRLLVGGTCALIFFHAFVNAMMISGLLPVVGLPFPFLSYGRSHLITLFVMLGLCCNAIKNSNTKLI